MDLLYLDISGSTEKYWKEHRAALDDNVRWRRVGTTFMFHVKVVPWGTILSIGGGTDPVAVLKHAQHVRIRDKVTVVTDDVDRFNRAISLEGAPSFGWMEVITFEQFLGLEKDDFLDAAHDLLLAAQQLEEQVEDFVDAESGSRPNFAKLGVEYHGKLRRATKDLHALLGRTPLSDGETHAILDETKSILHRTTETVLRDVFFVDSKELQMATREPKAARLLAANSTPSHATHGVFADDNYATATVSLGGHQVTGVAKRDPADVPNKDIGMTLAYGRALRKLGGQLINEANQAVVAADKVRRKEVAAKTAATAEHRKAEKARAREARAAAEQAEAVTRLAEQVAQLQVRLDDAAATIEEQSGQIANFQRLDKQRKARARRTASK